MVLSDLKSVITKDLGEGIASTLRLRTHSFCKASSFYLYNHDLACSFMILHS